MTSGFFKLNAGVRQGGLLSPCLFSVYIDQLINSLIESNLGCKIGHLYCGCIVYADDIILLSQSVQCMQRMLSICDRFSKEFDMKFNNKKSVACRIGRRYNFECASLILSGSALLYVKEFTYLGVMIKADKKFTVVFSNQRSKFYRSFNAIYCKSKYSNCELISVNLMKSYCIPIITYCTESLNLKVSECKLLDNCLKLAVAKIFNCYDAGVLSDVRKFLQIPMLRELYINKKVKFFNNCILDDYGRFMRNEIFAELLS